MENRSVLTINPGSTSTKIGVFNEEGCVNKVTLRHTVDELKPFDDVMDQKSFRKEKIVEFLEDKKISLEKLVAVVGRGGFMKSISSGTYEVNDEMVDDLMTTSFKHASNLGALIAKEIGDELKIPSFVVDPVSVNETHGLAKISGINNIERRTLFHCLNVKAVSRIVAESAGKKYEDINMIVAHLGGGISVSAHRKGRTVDATCGLLGEGSFSPERAGTTGLMEMMQLCFDSGKSKKEVQKMLLGNGGLVSYLGSNDALEIEKMIDEGNEKAELIYQAMAYQISKDISGLASVLKGDVDIICLTGGLAHSKLLTGWIEEAVSFISDVIKYPGEMELEAMSIGAFDVLNGKRDAKVY